MQERVSILVEGETDEMKDQTPSAKNSLHPKPSRLEKVGRKTPSVDTQYLRLSGGERLEVGGVSEQASYKGSSVYVAFSF